MATLSDVVKQLQEQRADAQDNAEQNTRGLTDVKSSVMKLIELQKPSMRDRESAFENSKKIAKVSKEGRFSGSGFGSGLSKGLGVDGIMGMLGSVLTGAMAGIGTVLYGVGLAAGTAVLAAGALFLAPKIGEWVEKLLENTFKDLDIPFLGNDKETKDSVRHAIGDSVKWGVYGIMVAKLLGKRFGIIFAGAGWVYETINDWLTVSASNEGTWANSLAKGWDEYFDTNNGIDMMSKIGGAIAAAITAFTLYKTPAMLRAINPFKPKSLSAAQRAALSSMEVINGRNAGSVLTSAQRAALSSMSGADYKKPVIVTTRPLGTQGLTPDMFDPKDLKGGPKNSPLRGAALNSRMESLARQGKFLESAMDAVIKTPWYTKFGKGLLTVAKILEAPAIGVTIASVAQQQKQDPLTATGLAVTSLPATIVDSIINLPGDIINAVGGLFGLNPGIYNDSQLAQRQNDFVLKNILDQETPAEKAEAARIAKNKLNGPPIGGPWLTPTPYDYQAPPRADAPASNTTINNSQFETFNFGHGGAADPNDYNGLTRDWFIN